MKDRIRTYFEDLYPETLSWRTHLHEHPELSFCEEKTSEFVQSKLKEFGVLFRSGIAKYGILATIEGNAPGKTIALRADMDALPITEEPTHNPCSKNVGVMHACGHDFHTASLLAVVRYFSENQNFAGRIQFIFQPGEESDPGGARLMLRDNLFVENKPDLILAAHVQNDIPVGKVGFCAGNYMASGDEVHLRIKGHGGHAGMPHFLNDTVFVACQTVVALQELVAREVPATIPVVLSFGKIEANGATNVIPDEVYIAGTLRALSEEWRARMKTRIAQVAENISKAFNVACDIDIRDGYPSVFNDPNLTNQAQTFARDFISQENVLSLPQRMTAEDFGFFTREVPSVFYRFGVQNAEKTTGAAHTAGFNPDPKALMYVPAVMTYLTTQFLKAH